MKKKGFTLIELLAVIAIMAIVLVVSVPIVIGVLDKSKKQAFIESGISIIKALSTEKSVDAILEDKIDMPEEGKSKSVSLSEIGYENASDIKGNIVITNIDGDYKYYLYITNGEYKICNKEYNKVKQEEVEKGKDCENSLLYPTIENKYKEQTYNYKYNITEELILNGVSAEDARDGNITNKIKYKSNINTNVLGEYEVVYTVENSLGNTSTTTRTVYVKDIESPTILNTINSVNLNKGEKYTDFLNGVVVIDNYDKNLTATYLCKDSSLKNVDCDSIGTRAGLYYVVYDAVDSSGNKYSNTGNSEVRRSITIKDISGPNLVLKGDNPYTMEIGSTYREPGYESIDDEDGDITSSVTTSSNLNTKKLGTYEIEYISIDGAGNQTRVIRTVKVVDTTAPTITEVTGNPTNWVTSATLVVNATDNVGIKEYSFDGGSTWQTQNSKKFNNNQIVNIVVKDTSENISEVKEIEITQIDNIKPTVTMSATTTDGTAATSNTWYSKGLNFTLTKGTTGPSGYTIYYCKDTANTCNPGIEITSGTKITSYDAVTGTYYIRYKIVGGSGVSSSVGSFIAKVNTTPPTITNKYKEQTYNYKYNITKELILNGVSANDTLEGDITSKIIYTSNINTTKLGTYTVTYRVENNLGVSATTTRTIHVKDLQAPTITNEIETESVSKGTKYTNFLTGITVTDNYDSNITATYICKNASLSVIDCNNISARAGLYYVIYDATDTSGNKYSETSSSEVKRTITVKDVSGPNLVLKGNNPYTMEIGSTYKEPGYESIDDEDGDITSGVTTSSNLNTKKLGTYEIEYISIDKAENKSRVVRIVKVVDTTAPTITGVTGNPTSWATSATLVVNATDNVEIKEYSFDNGTTWQTQNSKKFTSNGTINIKVKDTSGNVSSTSITITKVDSTSPKIDLSGIPDTIKLGDSYKIPTSYTVNSSLSGGSVTCKVGSTVVTDTKTLLVGSNTISCTATTGAAAKTTVSKTVTVKPIVTGDVVITADWPNTTSMKLTLSGVATSGTLEYRCKVGTKDTGWQTSSTCNITGLTEGTAYTVIAYARDKDYPSEEKNLTTTIYTSKTVTVASKTAAGKCPTNTSTTVAATDVYEGATVSGTCSQTMGSTKVSSKITNSAACGGAKTLTYTYSGTTYSAAATSTCTATSSSCVPKTSYYACQVQSYSSSGCSNLSYYSCNKQVWSVSGCSKSVCSSSLEYYSCNVNKVIGSTKVYNITSTCAQYGSCRRYNTSSYCIKYNGISTTSYCSSLSGKIALAYSTITCNCGGNSQCIAQCPGGSTVCTTCDQRNSIYNSCIRGSYCESYGYVSICEYSVLSSQSCGYQAVGSSTSKVCSTTYYSNDCVKYNFTTSSSPSYIYSNVLTASACSRSVCKSVTSYYGCNVTKLTASACSTLVYSGCNVTITSASGCSKQVCGSYKSYYTTTYEATISYPTTYTITYKAVVVKPKQTVYTK